MRRLFYDPFGSNRCKKLAAKCAGLANDSSKVFYILPSKEAMLEMKHYFNEEGIRCNILDFTKKNEFLRLPPTLSPYCYIMDFSCLEKLIAGEHLKHFHLIDNIGKRILLKHILSRLDRGMYYNKVKTEPGFLRLLIDILSSLKRQNIEPEELHFKINELEGNLLRKCRALQEIYSSYEKTKKQKHMIDSDDVSIAAAEICANSDLFKNVSTIVIDGFFEIDPVNLSLLENIYRENPDISMYANLPFKNKNNKKFLEQGIIRDLKEIGFEFGTGKKAEETLMDTHFISIAQSLYSGNGDIPIGRENFEINNSPCIEHEIRAVALKVKELIHRQSINPSKIAIVVADAGVYRKKAAKIFGEYGIPIGINQGEPLTEIPLIRDILALWRLGIKGEFKTAFITVICSKYLLPFEVIESEGFKIDRLLGIAEDIFKMDTQGDYFQFFLNEYAKNAVNKTSIEAMEGYLNNISNFNGILQNKTSDGIEAFSVLLNKLQIDKNISLLHKEKLLNGRLGERDRTALEVFSNLFSKLYHEYERYGVYGRKAGVRELIGDISDAALEIKMDQMSGDEKGIRFILPCFSRGQIYDTVFMLGVNEGVFPAPIEHAKLFSINEIGKLYERGIKLGQPRLKLEREKLAFNACIASAFKRLYISYRTLDESGEVMLASPFVDEVIFVLNTKCRDNVVSLPVSMRERMKQQKGVLSIGPVKYFMHASNIEFSREMGNQFDAYDGKLSDPSSLYKGMGSSISVSSLNAYIRCPFIYFVQRVLGFLEEDDTLLEMLNMGDFYHKVLYRYHLKNKNPCIPDFKLLTSIFDNISSNLNFGSIPKRLRNFFSEEILTVLRNFIIFDAKNMLRYRKVTGLTLKPVMLEEDFETSFGGGNAILKGRVDRVDLEADEQGFYTGRFVVYDYKKGRVKGIKECIEGKDLQLALYCNELGRIIKDRFSIENPECLAALYYSIERLEWNGIIRKDIKKALFEGRKGTRSTPDKVNMEILLSWVETEAIKVISNIRNGYFMPPKECPASAIFGCNYDGVCRYERIRLARKEG